jgi:SAM-dependent methyltransferase
VDLVCPRDALPLASPSLDALVCSQGHTYPVVSGIPVLLVEEDDPTGYATATLERVRNGLSITTDPVQGIDETVQRLVSATGGYLYAHLVDGLPRYPIPEIRLPPGKGRRLLDVGSGWGRWSIAAARRGYQVVAVDPWLEELAAAVRVARQLNLHIGAICADATHLPFAAGSFDVAFSYSVLQHFDKGPARRALAEMGRVCKRGGTVLVQFPNLFGVRQAFNRVRQLMGRGDAGERFHVRYWTPGELRRAAERAVGPATVSVDGFFSLNVQASDADLMPLRFRWLIAASEALRDLSVHVPMLVWLADSVYVQATR